MEKTFIQTSLKTLFHAIFYEIFQVYTYTIHLYQNPHPGKIGTRPSLGAILVENSLNFTYMFFCFVISILSTLRLSARRF